MPKVKIIFLVGPTATGKSETAVCLARKLKAEIISCDSMQVYRGMDILTAKPPVALRKAVAHHLMGRIYPREGYDVSRYRKDAVIKIKEITRKGKIPLFVGGTGLYMSILVDGIFKMAPVKKIVRRRLYREIEKKGAVALYKRLKDVDPQAAEKIHPHDAKRIIRALEVFLATGKPISFWQQQRKGLGQDYAVKIFCLNLAREKLYQRIEARVERMFKAGVITEVKRLLKTKLSRTAGYAIGIKEIAGYLKGKYSLEQARDLMKLNTRRYAKRQLTWFRRDRRIQWVNLKGSERPQDVARKIWKKLS